MWLWVCVVLGIIIQIPLSIKCRKAINDFDFSRQVAVIILMVITALLTAGLYKLGLFVLGLV